MKKALLCLLVLGFILGLGRMALAANTATQTVTIAVSAINEISVSSGTVSLTVNSATAGSQPTNATDGSTSYAITTNESNKKITGQINSAMPANTTLAINLVAPTGGSSAGTVTLSTSPSDLVTGISTLAESGKTITYTLSATIAAGIVASTSRTVTLTLTN